MIGETALNCEVSLKDLRFYLIFLYVLLKQVSLSYGNSSCRDLFMSVVTF